MAVSSGSIIGKVWKDDNRDALLSESEAGLAGVTVTLWREGSAAPVRTVVTAADGRYSFGALSAGTYYVKTGTLSADYVLTTKIDPVVVGNTVKVVNVGWAEELRTASLSGMVFKDASNNGVRDAGDAGIAKVGVELRDAGGNLVKTTTTDADGKYSFTELKAGNYVVSFVGGSAALNGLKLVAGDQGGNDAVDSDVTNASLHATGVISLATGEAKVNVDAGYTPAQAPAVIGGDTSGKVQEDVSLTSTGKLTVTDVNAGEATFKAGEQAGTYGKFVLAADGTWTYTLNNSAANVQALLTADTKPETFTVQTADGTTQVITVNVQGLDEKLNIGGKLNGEVTEDGTATATGKITGNDAAGKALTFPVGEVEGNYGKLVLTADGIWTYVLDNAKAQPLKAGETASDVFSLTTADGQEIAITVTVNGTNDVPVVTGTQTAVVTENNGTSTVTASGTVVVADADRDESGVKAGNYTGAYGTVVLDASGKWVYTLDQSKPAVTGLNNGQTLTDTISYTTADGTVQKLTITINGKSVPTGTIGDQVYFDENGDGQLNGCEKGITGVKVALLNVDGTAVLDQSGKAMVTTTGADGKYQFVGVMPGSYKVDVIESTLQGATYKVWDSATSALVDKVIDRPVLGFTQVGDTVYPQLAETASINKDGTSVEFKLDSSGAVTTQDFGVRLANSVTISDFVGMTFVLEGLNGDKVTVEAPPVAVLYGSYNGKSLATLCLDPWAPMSPGTTYKDYVQVDGASYYGDSVEGKRITSDLQKLYANFLDDAKESATSSAAMQLAAWEIVAEKSGVYDVNSGTGFKVADGSEAARALANSWLAQLKNLSSGNTTLNVLTNGHQSQDLLVIENNCNPTMPQDPSAPKLGSIGDRIWFDTNNDGKQTAGELGVANVHVKLLDSSDRFIAEAITDSTGAYRFDMLMAGDYRVVVASGSLPAGYTFTLQNAGGSFVPNQSSVVDSTGQSNVIKLAAGQNLDSVDAGLIVKPAVDPATASLSGVVFKDANNNGVREAGDAGIAAVGVELRDAAGALVKTMMTDASGKYSFTGLKAGNYVVDFVEASAPLSGMKLVAADQGGNDAVDSDASNISTHATGVIALAMGEAKVNIDAGYAAPAPVNTASIMGQVWLDNDRSTTWTGGDAIKGGVMVDLYQANPDGSPNLTVGKVASVVTDASGTYNFNNLAAGKYVVDFNEGQLPAGYKFFTAANSNIAVGQEAAGWSKVVDLATAQKVEWFNAGANVPVPVDPATASLSGVVFKDANNNGVREAGDTGIAAVGVELRDAAGALVKSMMTDADGKYSFTGLKAGSYVVDFVETSAPLSGMKLVAADQGGNDAVDSDATNTSWNATGVIALAMGEAKVNIDAGYAPPQIVPATVSGTVWNDANQDGIRTGNETGIKDVVVQLRDMSIPNGVNGDWKANIVAEVKTDASGNYSFTNVAPGNYKIDMVEYGADGSAKFLSSGGEANVLKGLTLTSANAGSNDAVDSDITDRYNQVTDAFVVKSGDKIVNLDAGYFNPVPVDPATASLSGVVFKDANNNGVREAGDTGIAAVGVELRDAAGVLVKTNMTDADGKYSFTGLKAGNYVVDFVEASAPLSGLKLVAADQGGNDAVDSDATNASTHATGTIALAMGEAKVNIDAGYYKEPQLGTIGDTVYLDSNGNGTQDGCEKGITGVKVALLKADGTAMLDAAGAPMVATTGADGKYQFIGLVPGNYKVDVLESSLKGATYQAWDTSANGGAGGLVTKVIDQPVLGFTQVGETLSPVTSATPTLNQTGTTNLIAVADGSKVVTQDFGVSLQNTLQSNGAVGSAVKLTLNGVAHESSVGVIFGNYNGAALKTLCLELNQGILTNKTYSDYTEVAASSYFGTSAEGQRITNNLLKLYTNFIDDAFLSQSNSTALQLAAWEIVNEKGEAYNLGGGVFSVNSTTDSTTLAAVETAKNWLNQVETGGLSSGTAKLNVLASGTGQDLFILDKDCAPSWGQPVIKGMVSGKAWNDANNNGVQDAGESGIPGVQVDLRIAGTTTSVAATTTDAYGNYSFANVAPGSYFVDVNENSASIAGKPFSAADQGGNDLRDSDVLNSGGWTHNFTVLAGGAVTNVDAGIVKSQTGLVTGKVWDDVNNNGIREDNEAGIAGVRVDLLDAFTKVSYGSILTDANGNYGFAGVPAGTYIVDFDENSASIAGKAFSALRQGSDTNKDSDVTNAIGLTNSFVVTSGNSVFNIDAGVVSKVAADLGTASLSGMVWHDVDNNGWRNDKFALEYGIAKVGVELRDAAGNLVKTAVTDENGQYKFTGLKAGNYVVDFVENSAALSGLKLVAANQGSSDAIDSDVTNTSWNATGVIALAVGESKVNVDAGYAPPEAAVVTQSVSGKVWNDANNNGAQDAGESGIAGVSVDLRLAGTVNSVASAVTDASGNYVFKNVATGNYFVDFAEGSAPIAGRSFSKVDQGGNDAKDSDVINSGGWTNNINVAAGSNIVNVDAGVVPNATAPVDPKTASLSGQVWADGDRNNTWSDGADRLVENVRVDLYKAKADGTADLAAGIVATTTTTAGGNYVFRSLAAGSYVADFNEANLPSGYKFVTGTGSAIADGSNSGMTKAVTLAVGENKEWFTAEAQPDNLPGSVSGIVWIDQDKSGGKWTDPDYVVKTGVRVDLYEANADGSPNLTKGLIATTTTDGTGAYKFSGVKSGVKYMVDFNENQLPSGGKFVTHEGIIADASNNGWTKPFTLTSGQNLEWWDGEAQLTIGTVTGYTQILVTAFPSSTPIWSNGDASFSGVDIYTSSGVFVTHSQVTNSSGHFSVNLAPGNYYLVTTTNANNAWGAIGGNGSSFTVTAGATVNVGRQGIYTIPASPIAVDLDGDGSIGTTAAAAADSKFDLLGTGDKVRSGWLAKGDGFLVIDTNHNGKIDSVNEMFGGAIGAGFAKLAKYDTNGDGIINIDDGENFLQLKVWQDANGDRITDPAELKTLAEVGVVSLKVSYEIDPSTDGTGNLIIEKSTAVMADGHEVLLGDVYFHVDTNDLSAVNLAALAQELQDSAAHVATLSAEDQAKIADVIEQAANDVMGSAPDAPQVAVDTHEVVGDDAAGVNVAAVPHDGILADVLNIALDHLREVQPSGQALNALEGLAKGAQNLNLADLLPGEGSGQVNLGALLDNVHGGKGSEKATAKAHSEAWMQEAVPALGEGHAQTVLSELAKLSNILKNHGYHD